MNEAMLRNSTALDIDKNYDQFSQEQMKWAVERLLVLIKSDESEIEAARGLAGRIESELDFVVDAARQALDALLDIKQ